MLMYNSGSGYNVKIKMTGLFYVNGGSIMISLITGLIKTLHTTSLKTHFNSQSN